MNQTPEKSCGKKRQYLTRHLAIRAVRVLRNRDHQDLEPYRCDFCDYYHISHSRPPEVEQTIAEPWES